LRRPKYTYASQIGGLHIRTGATGFDIVIH
jgi:hypothetical protein